MAPPTDVELNAFYEQLDAIPALRGAGVAYAGGGMSIVLRPSQHVSGLQTFVVLQEDETLESTLGPPGADASAVAPGADAPPVPAPSDIAVELLGLGLNCGGAVLSGTVVYGGIAAAPLTGGASTVLSFMGDAAFYATAAQCLISVRRSYDMVFNRGEWDRWIDSQSWYPWVSYSLDAVSLGGAAESAFLVRRAYAALKRASGRPLSEVFAGLTRAERKQLTKELIRMQRPGISNKGVKELIRIGEFPARFSATAIDAALHKELRDAISATLAFTGSGATGIVHKLYVYVFQE
jgi:hypothetical protein